MLKRWGHDFTRNREGECLTLRYLGKSHVSKGNTQKHMPILLMRSCFHLPSCCGESQDVLIIHPSMFPISLSSVCMCSPSSGFHPKTLWSIMIFPYSILCMHAVHFCCLQNRVFFWVVRLLLPSLVVVQGSHVSGSLFCCVDIVVCVCAYFFLGLN